jgi:hypothetical protein
MKSKYLFHYGMFFDIDLIRYLIRSSPSQKEAFKVNPDIRMRSKLIGKSDTSEFETWRYHNVVFD